jgi:hypothetical protein
MNEPFRQEDSSRPRRSHYDWPHELLKIVRQKLHPSTIVQQLHDATGYPIGACWRYAEKHGVHRPGKGQNARWTKKDIETVLELSGKRSVRDIAARFKRSEKAIYCLLHRHGRCAVGRSSDLFGLTQLAKLLSVRLDDLKAWAASGCLKSTTEKRGTIEAHLVSGDDLVRFCKQYREKLFPSTVRIPEKRIAFIIEYLMPEKVPDDRTARASKREREAYERGEYLEPSSDMDSAA